VIGLLPPRDLALLVQGIVSYKKGEHDFRVLESQVTELVKIGIFVKTSETAIGRVKVAFPSPLHFDFALYNILYRKLAFQQDCDSFETFIRELVLRMSPKVLLETTPQRNGSVGEMAGRTITIIPENLHRNNRPGRRPRIRTTSGEPRRRQIAN